MADLFANPADFGVTPAAPPPAPPADDKTAAPAAPDFHPNNFNVTTTAAPGAPGSIDPITGRPFQFAGNVPSNDPVGQSTGQPIQEGREPGFGTQAIGSLPTDPEQRRRVIAAQLFPKLDPKEAQARVFYGPTGQLAAVGEDNQPYYVDPRFSVMRPGSWLPTAGSMVGPALPAIGGAAAGAAAGPASLVVGPVAAGAGAAAGDVARQQLAAHFDPESAKTPYNPMQTAGQAGGAAGGQLAGASLLHIVAPNRLGASAIDVNRIRAGQALPQAERNQLMAQQEGLAGLTPGQASGLPSLLQHEDTIASGSAGPELSDIAQQFYGKQRADLQAAYQRHLDAISPAADKTDAAMQFQQGAEDATAAARQIANRAARPSYEAAQAGGNVMSPDLAQLAEVPAVKSALQSARSDYANLYRKAAPDTPDFALWDLAKRKLDDTVSTARRAGENTTAMSVDSLRADLLSNLDTAYPTYATARATAAPGQRLASRLEDSIGRAADASGNERAKAIVSPVFDTNNPRAISEARDAFTSAGRGDEWNAGVRSYLQDTIDRVSKSQEGLNPSMLRRQLWADPDKRAAMQAAMDPTQFQGLDNFMGTIERVAQSRGMNSLTAPRQRGAAALDEAGANSPGVRAARLTEAALDPSKLLHAAGRPFGMLAEWQTRRNIGGIAERLFSPEGVGYLRQMAGMSPGSQRALSLTAEFLGQQTGGVVGSPSGPRNELGPP